MEYEALKIRVLNKRLELKSQPVVMREHVQTHAVRSYHDAFLLFLFALGVEFCGVLLNTL